jgi:AsmA protein
MKRKGLIALGILVVVVLVVLAIVPLLFDANRYRPEIESRLSQSLGRSVKIGSLKLSLFSGGITAGDITIAEDPAFGSQPFVQAKGLSVGVEMMPLIFSKQLKIESLVLDSPEVRLLQSAAGKWNIATVGSSTGKQQGNSGSSGLSVNKLEVSNGRIDVGEANGKQESYTDLNLKASGISSSSSFPFTLSLAAPQGGAVKIDGTAGPLATDLEQTPFNGDVTIKNFDLAATGFVSPESGLAGVLDYQGKVSSNGKIVESQGKADASKLRLVKAGSSASQPIQVDYHSSYDLTSETGSVSQTTIHTGKSSAALSGTYDAHGATTNLDMHLTASQMATADVEGLLPALGVVLPAGSSLQGGTVTTNLALKGPSDKLVTSGTLNVANAKLAGFSMGKGLSGIASLAGIRSGSDTTIQVLSSNIRIAPEGMRLDNLNLVVPELGSMTGAGTIGADSSLNFHLAAKLAGGGGANPVGLLSSALGSKSGLKAIPIAVTGTTSKPIFTPDVGSAVASQVLPGVGNTKLPTSNPVGGLLGGLLGGKKKN